MSRVLARSASRLRASGPGEPPASGVYPGLTPHYLTHFKFRGCASSGADTLRTPQD